MHRIVIPLLRLRNRTAALTHWVRGLFGTKAAAAASNNRRAGLPAPERRIRAHHVRLFDELDPFETQGEAVIDCEAAR